MMPHRPSADRPFASVSWVATVVITVFTLLAFVAIALRLHLDPNVASLLPEHGDAAALRRYVQGFGGGDLAVIMVKSPDPAENATVAAEVARRLAEQPSVVRTAFRLDMRGALDPMLAFRYADARALARVAPALTPEGMRARLAEARSVLLLPGSGPLAEQLRRDPLRLTQLIFQSTDVGSGVRPSSDGRFTSADGTVHLVLVQARGQALRGTDARAFVADVEKAIAPVRAAHPAVTLGLTGGHAIAAATEDMLKRDLAISGTLSAFGAMALFALTFRRLRALLAVMPPLAIGTAWTAGLATLFPGGLSAIAVAFTSVVVGVGVDTGVHVYSALLDARREGFGAADAARVARQRTATTVLSAAVTAGAAFAALGLSDIGAVRQLGLLCAAGEVLTSIAIVIVTPAIGAWLERGAPPALPPHAWTRAVAYLTATRRRALVWAAVAALPIVALVWGGMPPLADAFVAVRPTTLAPLLVQQQIFEAFGGKPGQWVVMVADPDLERARARGDKLAERLATMSADVDAVDALTALAPALATQHARLAARDRLALAAKADVLRDALRDTGYVVDRFAPALDGMRHPSHEVLAISDVAQGAAGVLLSRYLAEDAGDHLVALYVQPSGRPGATERIEEAVRAEDPHAMLTGYSRLETSLRASLRHDMPRISAVAAGLVMFGLAASLRHRRDVVLAALVVMVEIAVVLLLIRVLDIPLHVYDALVLPVLLGITVDEGMFLLAGAREATGQDVIGSTLRRQGPLVAATALTTAAGFGALAFCQFDGLRDLGLVGAIGSAIGLLVALLVVPAGLRLALPRSPSE